MSCPNPPNGAQTRPVAPGSCPWCGGELASSRAKWCSKSCRQTAWRTRKLIVAEDLGDTPKRLGYADPPYPGKAWMYRDEPEYAGEVDHRALVSRLQQYDGWALSTSARALRDLLPLCPPEARVAPWVKPNGAPPKTRGPHNSWEPVIYLPARTRRPGKRDWLACKPARGGGTLKGRKPIGFCIWLFQLLGASPVDELDDLFPGTGVVQSSWRQFQVAASLGCPTVAETRSRQAPPAPDRRSRRQLDLFRSGGA